MKLTYKHTNIACSVGYVTQAIVVNLAPLFYVIFQTDFSVSYSYLGSLVLVTFLVQVAVDLAAVKIIPRLGYRKAALLSQLTAAAGLIMLGLLPRLMTSPEAAIMLSAVVYSIGGGLLEVILSPVADSLPSEAKASTMSLLHSFYSWGQVAVVLVTTVLLRVFGRALWYLIPFIWALVPLFNFVNFMRVPLPSIAENKESDTALGLFKSPLFILTFIMMICSGASEQVMSQWTSLFSEKALMIPKALGDLSGPCLFAVLMGIGRTIYGVFGAKIHLRKALFVSSIFTFLCYIICVFVSSPAISLLGCAFCGLGVSLMWPGMMSMTARKLSGGAVMFSMFALGGDIGCSLGPYLCGFISDIVLSMPAAASFAARIGMSTEQFGLKCGILASSVFPLLMIIGIGFIWKRLVKAKPPRADNI